MAPNITDAKCILVIGATAGIGRALALALADLPSAPTVIVAGRRQERIDEIVSTQAGKTKGKVEGLQVNIDSSAAQLQAFSRDAVQKYPELDAVVLCAGVQRQFDFTKPETIDIAQYTNELNINYTAPFILITALLPHFLKLSSSGRHSFIIPVTSSLALQPLPFVPNYCATKAALHSLTLSLHVQLRTTNVHMMEVLPPLVESELHDHEGTTNTLSKFWMPLDEFTKKEMEGLTRGDLHISVGTAVDTYTAYNESAKEGAVLQMAERLGKVFEK